MKKDVCLATASERGTLKCIRPSRDQVFKLLLVGICHKNIYNSTMGILKSQSNRVIINNFSTNSQILTKK